MGNLTEVEKLIENISDWNNELSEMNIKQEYDIEIRRIDGLKSSIFKYDGNIEILKSLAELKFLIRELTRTIKTRNSV